jgi:hypothetical protein
MARCTKCGTQVADHVSTCWQCGSPINPFAHEGSSRGASAGGASTGDATGGLIPYKNMPALIGYYCGIFSLFPCVPVLSIASIVLGVMGLRKASREPIVKGTVHAWIGIVLGGISLVYNSLLTIGMVIAMFIASARQ